MLGSVHRMARINPSSASLILVTIFLRYAKSPSIRTGPAFVVKTTCGFFGGQLQSGIYTSVGKTSFKAAAVFQFSGVTYLLLLDFLGHSDVLTFVFERVCVFRCSPLSFLTCSKVPKCAVMSRAVCQGIVTSCLETVIRLVLQVYCYKGIIRWSNSNLVKRLTPRCSTVIWMLCENWFECITLWLARSCSVPLANSVNVFECLEAFFCRLS